MYSPRSFSWYISCHGTHWEFSDALFQQELIINSWPRYNLLLKIGRYTQWSYILTIGWVYIITYHLLREPETTADILLVGDGGGWTQIFGMFTTRMLGEDFDQHFFPKWVGWYILDYPMELTSSLGNWKSNGLECWGPNFQEALKAVSFSGWAVWKIFFESCTVERNLKPWGSSASKCMVEHIAYL